MCDPDAVATVKMGWSLCSGFAETIAFTAATRQMALSCKAGSCMTSPFVGNLVIEKADTDGGTRVDS